MSGALWAHVIGAHTNSIRRPDSMQEWDMRIILMDAHGFNPVPVGLKDPRQQG